MELVGKSALEFDLYDGKGKLLYKKGETLSADTLLKLNYINIYRKTEGVAPKPKPVEVYSRPKPLIAEKTGNLLIKGSRGIFDGTFNGEALKYNECAEVSGIILNEVTEKYEKFHSVEQLRVFDEYTYSHNVNVSSISVLLGIKLGLKEPELEELAIGSFLHDIGKMKVPREILNKPAKLEKQEMVIMRSHTFLGYKHIKGTLDLPDRIARIALDHQEKFNGKGYPNGLTGEDINFYARITSIADVYDALVSTRVYKKGMHPHDAIGIILSEENASFSPEFLDKFIRLTQESETRDEEEGL